ncbi:MAG: TonB receptor energy transduction system periplasmic component TonB [Phormidesmis priestleyi Ana]|uniref:TonB receptor energy transduction system periplasmic component TonB n=1 Tax=Phormidesmis priestleyi Ana TaxID=1666911 RepID=A0A0P7YZ14_9CYAN|nr:MAG: TonB receptor energy transduction system periplasmic component TonB [Phormidesmis priestleyi Ana]
MGFSKDNFEQYRREIRIMWRVLAVGTVVAGGIHFFSLPWISRLVSGSTQESAQIEATPIEIVVEEEVVQQTPDPEPEPLTENPEPAASAERPSAAPLATNAEPVPVNEVAAADTVAIAPAIATENGAIDGAGAVGESAAVGLVTGSGEPVEGSDRINLPDSSPPIEPESFDPPRPRTPVQEISLAERRSPTSRQVTCNPCSLPEYPITARREEIEGQPVINAIFDQNGRVIEAVIEVSSGNAAFDQAALEEAKKNWRFQDPEGLGGQVSVDVVYVITNSEQYEEAQQAGEIRTIDLPIEQQIRSIPSDRPSSPASGPSSGPSSGASETDDSESEAAETDTLVEPSEASEPIIEDTSADNASATEAPIQEEEIQEPAPEPDSSSSEQIAPEPPDIAPSSALEEPVPQ